MEECYCHNCNEKVRVNIVPEKPEIWETELKDRIRTTTKSLNTPRCEKCKRPLFELIGQFQPTVNHSYRPKPVVEEKP